jgi:hypothetical protein
MWVALAGPLSNLILAVLAALLFRFEFASIYEAFTPSSIIRPYGPLILITLVFVGPMIGFNIFGWIIGTAVNTLTVFLVGL